MTQLPPSFISKEWSYLCEVDLPQQPANFRVDDSSQTSDVEKKNVFIEDRIEGTSSECLNNSLVHRRKKTDVDVTVFPAIEQADDVAYNKRITTESLGVRDKDNAPSYIDKETNTNTLRDLQEDNWQSVGWSETAFSKTLASPGASTTSLKHIHTETFRGNVGRKVIQSPVSGKCIKDSGEKSLRSGGSSASWQGRQEANNQADIRDDKNVRGSTVLEALGDDLSKSTLKDCVDEENADDMKLSKQCFTGQSSSLVISDQPVSLSLEPSTHPSVLPVFSQLGFQGKSLRSENDGFTSTSALVQRSLGRRKQVNPRQRPARGQLSLPQHISVTQSEDAPMKSDNDSETKTNKNGSGHGRQSQGIRRRSTSVSQDTKFPHSNVLKSKQRESAVQHSSAPTGMSSLNESATRFIVPVLQSPSLPLQSPFLPSRPSPSPFQKINSGLPLSPFCFQSSVEANCQARQRQEQEETRTSLDKDDRNELTNSALSDPTDAAETSKPGNCKTGASSSLRQARTNVITSPQSTGHRTIVTTSPPTDTANLRGFCQSSNTCRTIGTTTVVFSSATSLKTTGLKAALNAREINMTALPSADSGNGCVYQQPSISEAYQGFGLGYKYKNIQTSINDINSSQEDVSYKAELTGTESTEHNSHSDSASVSFLTSTLRSSLKKIGQPRAKMNSSETEYQRGALDLTVDTTRATSNHDVLNEHPLLQPIACKDVDAKKHTKQKSLRWSFLEIKKKELRIADRDDEAAPGQNNTSACTSPGIEQRRDNPSNPKYCRAHVEVACPDKQVATQAEDAVQDGPILQEDEVTKQERSTLCTRSAPASVSQQQQKMAENSGETASRCNISAVSALLQSLTAKTKDAEWTSQEDTTQAIESFPAVATLTHIVSEIKRKDNTGKKSAGVNKSKQGNVRSQGTKRALQDRVAESMIQDPLHGSVVADEHTGAATIEDTYNPPANQTNISSGKGSKAKRSRKSTQKVGKEGLQLPSLENSGLKLPISSKTNSPSPMPSFPIPFGNVSFLPFQFIAHNIPMFTRHASNPSHRNTDTPSATIRKSDDSPMPARKEPFTDSPSHVKVLGTPSRYVEVDSEGSSVDVTPTTDGVDYSPAPLAGVPQSGSGIPVFFFLPHSQLLTLGATSSGCSTEIFPCQQVVVPMGTHLAPKSTQARRPTQRLRKLKMEINKESKVLPDRLSGPTPVLPQLGHQSVTLIENQTQPSVAQPILSRTLEESVECPVDICQVVSSTWCDDAPVSCTGNDINSEERPVSGYEISLNEGNNNLDTKYPQQSFHDSTEHLVPGARSTTLELEDKGRPTRQRRSMPNRYRTAIQEEELSEMSDFSEHAHDVSDDDWRPDNNNVDLISSSENETDVESDWDFDHNANRRSRKRSLGGTSRSRKIGSHNEPQKLQLGKVLSDCGDGYVTPSCFPPSEGRSSSEFRGSVSSTSCSAGTATSEASGSENVSFQIDEAVRESKSVVLQVRHSRPNRRRRRVPYTKEELTCRECSKVFANIYRLRRHEGSHREERPHICDICGKGFKQSGHRNEHRLTHDTVGRRSFLCHYCGVIINSRSSFRYHMMSHDQMLVDVAIVTSIATASENGVGDKTKDSTRHRKHTEATELRDKSRGDGATSSYTAYDCPHCPDRFATAQSLNSHLESHPEVALRCHVQPFMCEKCGRSFTYRHNLLKHRLLHVKPVKYADLYRRKVQEHISSGKPHFTCDTCGKVYLRKETLAKHCKTHLGIKPFQCHVCCKRFTQKIHLTVHSRLHTGIRPFQCRTCRCCFLDSTALARHVERDLCRQEGFSFNIGKRGRRPFHMALDGDKKQEERKKG